jgi:hypothetical protein
MASRNRKNRSNRRANTRRNRRNNMMGGSYTVKDISPQALNDTTGLGPQQQSIAQGVQFGQLTNKMHGGMGVYPGAVTDSGLPGNLHASARLLAQDQAFADIQGLRDQAGGRKRHSRKASRKSRKNRKVSRKNRKASRKNRKASRKNRKASRKNRRNLRMNGGGGALGYASTDAPGMLLTPAETARAGLNPEWPQ